MAVGISNQFKDGIYFCTFTCFDWIPLIQITNAYDNIYDSFRKWNRLDCPVLGYVIMPNHVHLLVYVKNIEQNIMQMVSNAKRFLAYEMVGKLKDQQRFDILSKMHRSVPVSQQRSNKIHQVFERSFDCKHCKSNPFIEQKLNYIHFNPVKGKWKLVEDYRYYPHSSAGFYELGIEGKVQITSYLSI